jgi:hypothetical protein
MKTLSFYKPNSYNKGSAIQLQFGLKEDDSGLYVSIIKQASWNNSTKRGSFSENAKDPLKNKKIKLNSTECGAMIRVLNEKIEKWSTVHKSNDKMTSLLFSNYIKDNVKMGHGLNITEKGKESFLIGFNNDESEILKIFLEEYIKFTFEKKNLE